MVLFCFLASLTSPSWDIWVPNVFWLELRHNARSWNTKLGFENTIGWCAFAAAPAEIQNLLRCIAACLLRLDLWALCCWCALVIYPKCLRKKQTPARVRFRTTDRSSPADFCSYAALPRSRKRWHEKKFPDFSDTVVFFWNHAPNTRSVRNLRRGSPFFVLKFVQTAFLLVALSCLALFLFRKPPLPPWANLASVPLQHANALADPRWFSPRKWGSPESPFLVWALSVFALNTFFILLF